MIEISLSNSEIKKYLDSYKRLFFRKQLDNPNSRLILDKKRESLGLTKEEVNNAENLLEKNLNNAIEFIKAILELNNFIIDEDGLIEIKEYCGDLKLEEEDIQNCIEVAKSSMLNKDNIESRDKKTSTVIEANVKPKENLEVKNNSENSKKVEDSKKAEKVKAKEILVSFDEEQKLEIKDELKNSNKKEEKSDKKEEKSQQKDVDKTKEEKEVKPKEKVEKKKKAKKEKVDISDVVLPNFSSNAVKKEVVKELKVEKVVEEIIEEVAPKEVIEIKEEEKLVLEPSSFIRYDKAILGEKSILDDILKTNSREFRIETLKVLFYNGCLMCVERFKDGIYEIQGRSSFTYERIRSTFYDAYSELIDYTHSFLTKEGINDNTIDKDKLFERIFGLQCLHTLSKQINKINIMINNSVSENQILNSIDRSVGIYIANSNKPHFETFAVKAGTKEIKRIFESARKDYSIRDNVERGIYNLILEAVAFINKCGLANFDIYTEDHGRTLNELLEERFEAKELIVKSRNSKNLDLANYEDLLKESIIKYPFLEDTYIELSRLEDKNITKYNLLVSAMNLIEKCGEASDDLFEEIKKVELDFYIEEINKIPLEANEEVKTQICAENIKRFNISNYDVIFDTEIKHFGYIVTNMDINLVSENMRIDAFRAELEAIKRSELLEEARKQMILDFKRVYNIRNLDCFKIEYDVFGKSFQKDIFDDLDLRDREDILVYCMKAIKKLANTDEEKRELLLDLQNRNIISRDIFRDIEKNVFEFVIPLDESENKEFEFMKAIKDIYINTDMSIKALDLSIKDEKWNIRIPPFYEKFKREQDGTEEVIMSYLEDDKTKKFKEGFVITDKAVYSSYDKKPILLSDIQGLKVKNYSKVEDGERLMYVGIFVDTETSDHKLCTNSTGDKEKFADMLNDIIIAYREINNLEELITFEEVTEDDMILGIDSENILLGNKRRQEELRMNLEGNKFYELMSDLLNYDNLSFKEILVELSTLVNSELAKKIYFNEITEGSGEKIREACTSYVMTISELEEIYLVCDNTKKFPLQFQKLGMVISSKGIYCKNRLEDAWFMDLKYATNIKTKDENKIQISNRTIEFPYIKTRDELYEMRDLIEFIVSVRKIMDNPLDDISSELVDSFVSEIEKYTLDLVNKIKSENLRKALFIHSEGATSEKKYAAAMTTYADLEDNENPILLFDSSSLVLKSSGFLITDKNFYYKGSKGNSMEINLLAVSRLYMKGDRFYINGIEIKLTGLSVSDKTELCEKLKKLFEHLRNVK